MLTFKEIGFLKGCLLVCKAVPQSDEVKELIDSIMKKLDLMIKENFKNENA